jgi:hypothetical protein
MQRDEVGRWLTYKVAPRTPPQDEPELETQPSTVERSRSEERV